jgi:hypothetical protein
MAAVLLANVSGSAVPMVMKVMAFTESFMLMKQPRWDAMSATAAVTMPIQPIERKKPR